MIPCHKWPWHENTLVTTKCSGLDLTTPAAKISTASMRCYQANSLVNKPKPSLLIVVYSVRQGPVNRLAQPISPKRMVNGILHIESIRKHRIILKKLPNREACLPAACSLSTALQPHQFSIPSHPSALRISRLGALSLSSKLLDR